LFELAVELPPMATDSVPVALAALPVEFTATYLEFDDDPPVVVPCEICVTWPPSVPICVSSANNWLPLTASVLVAVIAPAAILVNATAEVAPTPPSVTLVCEALSYSTASLATEATACNWLTFTASVGAVPAATPESWRAPAVPVKSTLVPPVLAPTVMAPLPGAPPTCCTRPTVPFWMPVDSAVTLLVAVVRPVDNEATLLLVVFRPVDSEATLLLVVLRPVDRDATLLLVVFNPVDSEATLLFVVVSPVDNDATLLFVVVRPVDKDTTPLCAVLTPVDSEVMLVAVEVESELN
jgi:hypothetical protein